MLAALDADQAHAAELVDGPLAVIAGPGSGKTRMLTHRIAHLVVERGVPATACLAVTFTRRATEELRSRLAALLPARKREVAVHSFHSLGLALLREHGAALGLAPGFRIADVAERQAALAAALGISASRAGRLVKAVSVLKRTGMAGEGEEREAREALARLGREQGMGGFRRSGRPRRGPAGAGRRDRGAVAGTLYPYPGRRVPGHRRGAVPLAAPARRHRR
ncbi:MAG: UvrD-helicase domain-containing protein [Magnetospirillum sp.]|nr:UvrD-helicase domain-containing protein [Magnetospirillum sp.]